MSTDDRATFADPMDDVSVLPSPVAREREEPDRYALGERIGKGGMGEVRAATDTRLRREVAVKLLVADGPAPRLRFTAEAIITARLQHPNIVPVHDLGELDDGTPYLAMKRVRGRSLAELLGTGQLGSVEHRLDIFGKICDAVAFAHARGVLHLDLKPDNVMVGEFGEVVLMDWGIARGVDGAAPFADLDSTPSTGVMGTPAYMAPEQAAGLPVSARTDVYGLGAVLYELLTDHPPYSGDTASVLAEVRRGALRRPRAVQPRLSSELERVLLRAMATFAADRYPSVLALREDITALLGHRPLVHVRSTHAERLAKWMDRHRGAVRATAALASVCGVGLLFGLWRYSVDVGSARDEALRSADRALAAEQGAVEALVAAQVALADALSAQGLVLDADRALGRAAELLVGKPELDRRTLDLALSQHVADNPPPISRCSPHGETSIRALDLADDGRAALSWADDGRLVRWDPVGCSPSDERALAGVAGPGAVDADRGLAAVISGDTLHLVDLVAGTDLAVAAPAGARWVQLDGATVWVRDAQAGLWRLDPQRAAFVQERFAAVGEAVWRPGAGGRLWLADSNRTGGEPGGAWDRRDGRELYVSQGVNSLDASGDAAGLLVGDAMRLRYIELATGAERWSRPMEPVQSVGVAPGDVVGWTQSFDGSVRVVDLTDGRPIAAYVGSGDVSSAVSATTDARLFAIGGADGQIAIYLRPVHLARVPPDGPDELVHGLAISPDGALIAVGDESGALLLIDAATGRRLRAWSGFETGVRQIAFSPDGRRLAAAVRYQGLAIFDLATGLVRRVPLDVRTVSVAWLGDSLRSVDVEGELLAVDPRTGAVERLGRGLDAASWGVAAHGDRLLRGAHLGKEFGIVVYDARGVELLRIPLDQTAYHVAWSPAGDRVAVACSDGRARVYELSTGALVRSVDADAGPTMGVSFSPDGTLLATTGYSRHVKLWSIDDGALLRAVAQHTGPGLTVSFSPDGERLYSGGSDGYRVLPLRANLRHAEAVAALGAGGETRAGALAALRWWERVEENAGTDLEDRRRVAQARLALGQPALQPGEDLYLQLLAGVAHIR